MNTLSFGVNTDFTKFDPDRHADPKPFGFAMETSILKPIDFFGL
jgi:hypothetical protein